MRKAEVEGVWPMQQRNFPNNCGWNVRNQNQRDNVCFIYLFMRFIWFCWFYLSVTDFFVVVGRMLSSLTPAHAVSVTSYLSHCERVCVSALWDLLSLRTNLNRLQSSCCENASGNIRHKNVSATLVCTSHFSSSWLHIREMACGKNPLTCGDISARDSLKCIDRMV